MYWRMSAVAGLAALAWAVNAEAQSPWQGPWYLEGSLGGYFRQPQEGPDVFHHSNTPTVTVAGTDTLKFSPGLVANLGVGRRITPHIRLEAEVGYAAYSGHSLNPYTTAPGFPALDGQTFTHRSGDRWSRYTGAVNAFYDFAPIAGRFAPYVGGGVGASANHRTNGIYADAAGQTFTTTGGSSTQGFAVVEGGVSIALSPHWAVVPAYRYVRYFADDQDVAHVAKVGLRYSF